MTAANAATIERSLHMFFLIQILGLLWKLHLKRNRNKLKKTMFWSGPKKADEGLSWCENTFCVFVCDILSWAISQPRVNGNNYNQLY